MFQYLAYYFVFSSQTFHIEELIGPKGKGQKNMRDLSPEAIYKYACEDADVTLKLKNILEQELKTNDAEKLFYEIEMPLVPVLAYMERNGVRVDTEALKQTSEHFTARMNQIEEEVHQLAGTDFNIASPKQVGEVLFDKLRIVGFQLLFQDVFQFQCDISILACVLIDSFGGEVAHILLTFAFRTNQFFDVDSLIMQVDFGKVVHVVTQFRL